MVVNTGFELSFNHRLCAMRLCQGC